MSIVRDLTLADSGQKKIEWVRSYMPVLTELERRYKIERPFAGKKISISIHLEAKTANLAITLAAGGAEVFVTGCNPLSTQDDVAAGLASMGINVFAWHGATQDEYVSHLTETLKCCPDIIIDDGGDFISLLHGDCAEYGVNLLGGCEETTTGVHRLRARAAAGLLNYPMIAVNDAKCKHYFDNKYGTGQSAWDAIMNTTNHMVSGKTVVIAGYGFCGKGLVMRAKGLGANVIVTEVDPFNALEAYMDGCRVMTMDEAAASGDIFITATGCNKIITKNHFEKMKNGVLLANAGHFDVEIDKDDLKSISVDIKERKPNIKGYYLKDGRVLNLLGEGRLVNLAAGNGHPVEIMDMSFGVQALCARYIAQNADKLTKGMYDVPAIIDKDVALTKLSAMGIKIDSLTENQEKYLSGWEVE